MSDNGEWFDKPMNLFGHYMSCVKHYIAEEWPSILEDMEEKWDSDSDYINVGSTILNGWMEGHDICVTACAVVDEWKERVSNE